MVVVRVHHPIKPGVSEPGSNVRSIDLHFAGKRERERERKKKRRKKETRSEKRGRKKEKKEGEPQQGG